MAAIPFRMDVLARDRERRASIVRGITAIARLGRSEDAAEYAKRTWPDDRDAFSIAQKAAVTPMTLGAPFAHSSVSDLISILGPKSGAFAQVASGAMQLSFGRDASLLMPAVTARATGVTFIAQAAPFPVRQLVTSGVTLNPQKIAVGFGLTREMVEATSAEVFVQAAIRENVALALDTLLLDANAGTTTRPAGLRNGLSTITATAGGGLNALTGDLAGLADAVSGVGGSDIAYCCSMKDYIKIKTLASLFPFPVYPTGGLPAGTVVCIALPALAIAGSSDAIRIERSKETAVHFEDTTPLPITTGGATPSYASPVYSAFQSDLIVIRLLCDLTWALRAASGAVAFVSSITW